MAAVSAAASCHGRRLPGRPRSATRRAATASCRDWRACDANLVLRGAVRPDVTLHEVTRDGAARCAPDRCCAGPGRRPSLRCCRSVTASLRRPGIGSPCRQAGRLLMHSPHSGAGSVRRPPAACVPRPSLAVRAAPARSGRRRDFSRADVVRRRGAGRSLSRVATGTGPRAGAAFAATAAPRVTPGKPASRGESEMTDGEYRKSRILLSYLFMEYSCAA